MSGMEICATVGVPFGVPWGYMCGQEALMHACLPACLVAWLSHWLTDWLWGGKRLGHAGEHMSPPVAPAEWRPADVAHIRAGALVSKVTSYGEGQRVAESPNPPENNRVSQPETATSCWELMRSLSLFVFFSLSSLLPLISSWSFIFRMIGAFMLWHWHELLLLRVDWQVAVN